MKMKYNLPHMLRLTHSFGGVTMVIWGWKNVILASSCVLGPGSSSLPTVCWLILMVGLKMLRNSTVTAASVVVQYNM